MQLFYLLFEHLAILFVFLNCLLVNNCEFIVYCHLLLILGFFSLFIRLELHVERMEADPGMLCLYKFEAVI